ncbi:MAG TPA: DUF3604 domain-containing protein [Candidatus Acidoferrales bacterium]|nr:DUF3604 domain-containing protein [Candidatus Acidoferrales bacterium]
MMNQRLAWARPATRAGLALLFITLSTRAVTAGQGPWARTETREPCTNFDTLRQPYFGDTHIHTAYSSDAVFAGTRENPRGAYQFAQGQPIGLPPYDAQGMPTRTAQLRRPLDFTAVTDHAEQFGEIQICLTPGLSGYDSSDCVAARNQLATPPPALPSLLPPTAVLNFLLGYGALNPPQRFSWCGTDGENCLGQASLVWQDTQAAAEEFYDRTAACAFTTFVAYEWSGQPGGNNLHRNIIFRNEVVPALPTSYMEQPTPQGLWNTLKAQCLDGLTGCDVLAIPHNPNASGGLMFAPFNADNSPLTADDATFRSSMEPLVEITQHKGDSECRPGVQSTDEICGYEKLNRLQLFAPISDPTQTFPPLNYVRNALKEGLNQEQLIGVNPFKLGFVGSTDDHNAAPGSTEERDFGAYGHLGLRDHATPAFMVARVTPAGIEGNPGGLAVVWAEENSRDALFAAMRRREVYATSGSRPIVRAFAGKPPASICKGASFAATGYEKGVPMGSDIGPVAGNGSPSFAVLAMKDAGTADMPGTLLQRIQMVKGWIDDNGAAQEAVFDITKKPNNGASVDTTTCQTSGPGADSLCAVWKDPKFKASQRAFYYARVLENPTCRWSTYLCNDQGIDCSTPSAVPAAYAECCNTGPDAVPKTIQERAWTSPFWYEPEAFGKVTASVAYGKQAGTDVLNLTAQIGAAAPAFNPDADDVALTVSDDDTIYAVTIPAGTMVHKGGTYQLMDKTGVLGGLKSVTLKVPTSGLKQLTLQTVPMDLSHADRANHFVEIDLSIGSYHATHSRLWVLKGTKLQTS